MEQDGDEYTLGPQHRDVLAFLIDQGQRRLLGSEAGKRSTKTKREFTKRGFRPPKSKGTQPFAV